MANIVDPYAIRFSDQHIRVRADALSKCYKRCVNVKTQWDALGGGQGAINLMESGLRACADAIIALYNDCFATEKVWFLGVNTSFPSDSSPVFDNGSFTAQDPNRPPITGLKVNSLFSRVSEFQNWLTSATRSFTDTARNNFGAYNFALNASSWGPVTMTVAGAGNLITLCGDIKTNYEASANLNLNTVLAVAVNPNL